LAIFSEIAPANGHTLLLVMVGMLVLLMLKMMILLELTLQTYDGDEEVLGTTATETYKALIVQRALSATAGDDDDRQRNNLFNMFLIVKDCRVHTIIDGGSCNNLVNVEVVKKLGLTTRDHPHPYHIQWFNNNGKFKVTKTARVHFSIGSYHDFADFDVVSMDACSLLLGRP
jgi:hypothetical protein